MKYSVAKIAGHLGITTQAVNDRAKKEAWSFTKRPGKGGGKLFRIEDLPPEVRQMIAVKECPYTPPPITPGQQAGLAAVMTLSGKRRSRAEARACVVNLYRSFAARAGMADTPCREAFAVRWAAGEIEADPDVRAALPRFSPNSLKNWVDSIQKKGASALAGVYGVHRKGTGIIESTPGMRESILGMLSKHPNTSVALIREWLKAKFSRVPSLRRLQAWVSEWKKANPDVWLYVTAPDKWRSRFMSACGNAYELIVRQNQLWEYDGTPSDIMLEDGKRYAIIGVINVYDRRLKLEVAPTETSRDVGNLTRRCLLDWGVPEEVTTDRGGPYVSKYQQQVFGTLRIQHNTLPAFRPDLKPAIERAFGTFSHHLLTLAPCYIGHNVATRQEIRERETFSKRLMDRKNPQKLSMGLTPKDLQDFCDDWCENTYHHRPHSGLNGRTPWEVSQSWITPVQRIDDERALDILLVPLATKDGFRTVGKKGLFCASGTYVAPELGGLVGHRVRVRVNPADLAWVFVFDEANDFVCRAARTDALSAEQIRTQALAARHVGKAKVKAAAKEMREMAKQTEAGQAMTVIRESDRQRADAIRATGVDQRSVVYTTPELEAAAEAANAHIPAVAVTEQAREIVPGFTLPATPRDRYLLFLELKDREDLSEAQAKWVSKYPDSQDYALWSDIHRAFAVNG